MDEATDGREGGVWQPPALDVEGGDAAPGGTTMPGHAPAADGQETSGPDAGGRPLDAAPVAVVGTTAPAEAVGAVKLPPGLDASGQDAGDEKKVGGGGRRVSVALMAATGVVALAAAPFAVVSPKDHFVGEPTSSVSNEHPEVAAKKKPAPGRTLAAPVPRWPAQGTPGQPGDLQSAPGELPDPAASGAPSLSPTVPGSPLSPASPAVSPSVSPETATPAPAQSPREGRVPSNGQHDPGSVKASRSPDRPTPAPTPTASADNQAVRTLRASRPTTSATAAGHHATSTTSPATSGAESDASTPGETRVIHDTYVFQPGQEVHTNRIRLTLRTDGDLVLSDAHGKVLWSTGTHASGTHAVFQADGNFVLYSSSNATLWSSNTPGHDGAVLVMQADGNLTIVQGNTTLWATGTAR
jgi:hypothetical protein